MDSINPGDPFDQMEDRILPWSQVKIISGLSRTTVWRMQKAGDFPACVQVSSNRVGWWQSELLAWRRARMPRRQISARSEPTPGDPPVVKRPVSRPAKQPTPKPAAATSVADKKAPKPIKRRMRKPTVQDAQASFDF